MSTLSIRLPKTLHEHIKKLSKDEQISINQFITNAVTEKMTAIETENYIIERAKRGDKDRYLSVLNKVKETPAED